MALCLTLSSHVHILGCTLSLAEFVYQYGRCLCSSLPYNSTHTRTSGAESVFIWEPCSGLSVCYHLLSLHFRTGLALLVAHRWNNNDCDCSTSFTWDDCLETFVRGIPSYSADAPPQSHSSPYSDFMLTMSVRIHIVQT